MTVNMKRLATAFLASYLSVSALQAQDRMAYIPSAVPDDPIGEEQRQKPQPKRVFYQEYDMGASFLDLNGKMRTYVNSEGLPLESITLMRQENNGSTGITDSVMLALIAREGLAQSPGDSITSLCYEVFTLRKDKGWQSQVVLATNPAKLDSVPVRHQSPTYDTLSALLY